MALGFNVCQLRATSYTASANNSAGRKSATIGFSKRFLVEATGIDSPDDVTDLQVAYANGIPLVNYHTWYDPNTGLGYPLAVCNSKTVKRLENNGFFFHVDCTFQTEASGQSKQGNGPTQEEPAEVPPVDVTDITPQISRSIVGREIVLYEAPAFEAGPNGGTSMGVRTTRVMPSTGNTLKELFDAPVTRTKPLLQLNVTQFENTFSNSTMMERCYKVNDAAWAGFPSKSCMITNINAVKQRVQMASGEQDKFRVTYTISYDDYTVTDSNGDSLFVGHSAALPLISRSYLDHLDDNKPKLFYVDELAYGNVGLINTDGHSLEDQDGAPDYIRFDTVDEISFSFLPDNVDI